MSLYNVQQFLYELNRDERVQQAYRNNWSDRDFLERWCRGDRDRLCAYTDTDVYLDAGQGGFEIRTHIAAAAAGAGPGTVHFYAPIPIFAVGCTIADINID